MPPVNPTQLGLIGINVGASTSFAPNPHYLNAIFDSRLPTAQPTFTLTVDANGWPAVPSQFVVSALPGGSSTGGQLGTGTYHCTVVSSSGSYCTTTLSTPTAGTFITNVVNTGDGVTTKFDLVNDSTTNLILNFSTPVSFIDIPRDGSISSAGKGWWSSVGIGFHSQFQSLRFMDFLGTNGKTEQNWSQRPPGPSSLAAYVPGSSPSLTSWELWIDYCNAVYSTSSSKVKQVWLNISGYVGTIAASSATDATTYATNLANLLNSYPINPNLKVVVEFGNEPWNPGFTLLNDYAKFGITELNVVTNYAGSGAAGGTPNTITSVVGDGTNVTVTASGSIPSYVTNGATCFATSNSGTNFQGGSISSPVAISNITNLGGSYSFTYPSVTSGTMGAIQFCVIFNTTSNLINDGSGFNNLFKVTGRFMERGLFRLQQAWSAVRPQDRFVINLQQYGSNTQAPMNFPPQEYFYGNYLGGGSGNGGDTTHLSNWLYGVSVAPYTNCTGIGSIVSGSTQITNFNLASACRVGDTLCVVGAGNTTSLTSPVIAINGTSVSLRNTTSVTATGVTVTSSRGSGVGTMVNFSNVITGLTISGLTVGDVVTVPTAKNTGLAAIVTDISLAASGTLTIDTAASVTVSNGSIALTDADPQSIIDAMSKNITNVSDGVIRAHVYKCNQFGVNPLFYEGGPDTQTTPLVQIEVHTDPNIFPVITSLLNTLYQNGGLDFHFFTGSPSTYVDRFGDYDSHGYTTSQDGWGACQNLTDTDTQAPVLGALRNYVNPGTFANRYGNPGTLTVDTLEQGNGTPNAVSGLYFFSTNSIARNADWVAAVNQSKTYTATVWIADNVSVAANLYIDNVLVGTSTVSAGSFGGGNNSAVAVAGTPLSISMTAGSHNISVRFPIGIGAQPGLSRVVFS